VPRQRRPSGQDAATVAAAHAATPQTGDWPARVSPMFMHASSSHDRTSDKEDGCASCHISLGRKRKLSLAQLDLKANQVPIVAWQKQDNKSQVLSCAACHNKLRGTGDDAKLYNELKGHADFYKQPEDKRAGQLFNCSYCHAPDLGTKQQVPCSHYWAFLNKDTGKLPPGVKNLLTEAYLKSLPDKVSSEHQCKDELTAAFAAK
jgi:cytochrome c553